MPDTGDAISVSLEDIALRVRAIVGRRTEFPAPADVARTQGPAAGASQTFRRSLNGVSQDLSRLTIALTTHLTELEQNLAATGRDLVAADESVADDVDALQWILSTVDEPVAPPTTPPSTSSGSAAFA